MCTVYGINSVDMENLLSMGIVIKFDRGGCTKGDPVKNYLNDDVKLYCVSIARRIPFPILLKLKAELERLEGNGIIEKVT